MYRYRTLIILVLLIAVPAGGAVVAARYFLPGTSTTPVPAKSQPAPKPVKKAQTRKVVAAARYLQIGTLIREEDLTALDVAASEVRRAHVVMEGAKTIDALRGFAVREPVAADAPITRSAVVGPGQRGFLAAVLGAGTRAATIQLSAGTSHAGLVDPGDRVDVILTAKLRLGGRAESVFTRTILQDVRVVAVDRQVDGGAQPAPGGKEAKRAKIVTATLEVSPAQAGLLALGEHEGTLSLVVRPLAAAAARPSPAAAVDLRDLLDLPEIDKPAETVAPAATPPPETSDAVLAPRKTVRIIRGDKLSEVTFGDEAAGPPEGRAPAVRPGDASPAKAPN